MPAKRKPTVKQLRARAKFVKMVRARSRASKAAKRAAGKRPTIRRTASRKPAARRNARKAITVVKNGRKLYGAAAQAVLNQRKKRNSSKRPGVMLTSRKRPATRRVGSRTSRNGIFRTAARRAVSRRLSAPIRFRRRRNSAPVGIEEIHQAFLGRPTDPREEQALLAPEGTPKNVAGLGELTTLEAELDSFYFDPGEAVMGGNAHGDLFVLGDVGAEPNRDFGEISEIRYIAQKDHLQENPRFWHRSRKKVPRRNGAEMVEYYHYFGEEGGRLPKLETDQEGMFHIVGGSYHIEASGIND